MFKKGLISEDTLSRYILTVVCVFALICAPSEWLAMERRALNQCVGIAQAAHIICVDFFCSSQQPIFSMEI